MAHIDRGYVNPIRSLKNKRPQKYRQDLDTWSRGYQLLGAFQPVLDITRDVSNIFRAYKGWRHVAWDLAQPVRGLLNGVAGIGQIIYSPIYLLGQLTLGNLVDAVKAPKGEKLSTVGNNTTVALARATSWIVNGAMKIVRGATQVAFTPLSWLKMIVRGISTAENKGVQRLVDDRNIQRLVKEGEALREKIEIETEKANAQKTSETLGLAENPDGLSLPLVKKSLNERKLEAINRQLELKFKKEVRRSTGKELGASMRDERMNNEPVQDNTNVPKRLHFIGTQKPAPENGSRNYVKFFKDASDARQTELKQISAKRFGRGAAAA
ncbi:MAG: hypothetical protein SFW07_01575 [Gammaproteobacteria bacterium]|nr:hypothetical protein [Gammaproteobacteria bacterium]